MIRFQRGTEPAALATRRRTALLAAIQAAETHGVASKAHLATLDNYDQGKLALHVAQHRKCAFCERWTPPDGNPLEHFRPKKGAIRANGNIDRAHYWWLCWSWDNHVFSCNTCNGQSRKGNHFPVASPMAAPNVTAGMTSIPPAAFDWSQEGATLIDPATEDPLDHLDWRPSAASRALNRKLWQWEVTGRTRRGTGTIAILKLDQNIDTISDHVRNNILPRVELVERSIGAGNPLQAVLDWIALVTDSIESPRAELRGPTFCALEYLVPSSTRQQNGLRSPIRP